MDSTVVHVRNRGVRGILMEELEVRWELRRQCSRNDTVALKEAVRKAKAVGLDDTDPDVDAAKTFLRASREVTASFRSEPLCGLRVSTSFLDSKKNPGGPAISPI